MNKTFPSPVTVGSDAHQTWRVQAIGFLRKECQGVIAVLWEAASPKETGWLASSSPRRSRLALGHPSSQAPLCASLPVLQE